MRVTIEVTEDEAAWLRTAMQEEDGYGNRGNRLLARVARALPRPIAVGDKVTCGKGGRVWAVVAICDGMAWIRRQDAAGVADAFWRVEALTLVEEN